MRRVEQAGRAVGIQFKHGGLIGPHTRDAHRLAYLSRSQPPEITNLLDETVFGAYHELEKDISSLEVLSGIALEAGPEDIDVDQWRNSKVAADRVDEEATVFREKVAGSGVLCYFIHGHHRLEGARDVERVHVSLSCQVKEEEGNMYLPYVSLLYSRCA